MASLTPQEVVDGISEALEARGLGFSDKDKEKLRRLLPMMVQAEKKKKKTSLAVFAAIGWLTKLLPF